jgi:hypothetical protein
MLVIAKAGHETNQMEKCMLRCVSREYICWGTMQFDRDQSEISTVSSLAALVCDMHSNWHAVSVLFGDYTQKLHAGPSILSVGQHYAVRLRSFDVEQ